MNPDTQKQVGIAAVLVVVAVVMLNRPQSEAPQPVPVTTIGSAFIAEYAGTLGEGFLAGAELIPDEDATTDHVVKFHKSISAASKSARIKAAHDTIDPALQEANQLSPGSVKLKAIEIGNELIDLSKRLPQKALKEYNPQTDDFLNPHPPKPRKR